MACPRFYSIIKVFRNSTVCVSSFQMACPRLYSIIEVFHNSTYYASSFQMAKSSFVQYIKCFLKLCCTRENQIISIYWGSTAYQELVYHLLFKRKFNYLNKFKQYSISRSSSKYTVLLLFLIVVQYSIIKAFTNNAVQVTKQAKSQHSAGQYN